MEELCVRLHALGKQSLKRMAQNSKLFEELLLHRAIYNTRSEYMTGLDAYGALRPPPGRGAAGEAPWGDL